MSSKRKSRKPTLENVVAFLATEFVARFGFDALRRTLEQLSRPRLSVTQRVSIARALRPYVAAEAHQRQAHGKTAPGRRCRAARAQPIETTAFVARCVGMAPATLRKAEEAVKIAEGLGDPKIKKRRLQQLDSLPVARVHGWLTSSDPAGAYLHAECDESKPAAGLEFGAAAIETVLATSQKCRKRSRAGRT